MRIKERLKRRYWKMVVIGLGVEMVAFGFSFLASNLEIAKINASNIIALNKTPGKLPVFTASAFCILHLGTNAINSTNRFSSGWTARLSFEGTNGSPRFAEWGLPQLGLVSSDLLWWGPDEHLTIPLQFTWKPGLPFNELTDSNISADDLLTNLMHFQIATPILFFGTKILDGSVTLVLNGAVAKKFQIPPQTIFDLRTNFAMGQVEGHWDITDVGQPETVYVNKYQ
jgi:hypothetical protein